MVIPVAEASRLTPCLPSMFTCSSTSLNTFIWGCDTLFLIMGMVPSHRRSQSNGGTASTNSASGAINRFAWRIIATGSGTCRSEEHTSELQSLMRISYAVFCLKKKKYTSKYNQLEIKPIKMAYKY